MSLTRIVVLDGGGKPDNPQDTLDGWAYKLAKLFADGEVEVDYLTSVKLRPANDRKSHLRIRPLVGGKRLFCVTAPIWLALRHNSVSAVFDFSQTHPLLSPVSVDSNIPVVLMIAGDSSLLRATKPTRLGLVARFISRRVFRDRPVCITTPSSRRRARAGLPGIGSIHILPSTRGTPRPTVGNRLRAARPTILALENGSLSVGWATFLTAAAAATVAHPDLRVLLVVDGEAPVDLLTQAVGLGLRPEQIDRIEMGELDDKILASAWIVMNLGGTGGVNQPLAARAAAFGVPNLTTLRDLRSVTVEDAPHWSSSERLTAAIVQALQELSNPATSIRASEYSREQAARLIDRQQMDALLSAVEQERGRLNRKAESRLARQDQVCLVDLSKSVAVRFQTAALRTSDQSTFCGRCSTRLEGPFQILLWGADEHDAVTILLRAAVDANDPDVRLRLARAQEIQEWNRGLPVHYYPTDTSKCPNK
jgi:hypothetical protein